MSVEKQNNPEANGGGKSSIDYAAMLEAKADLTRVHDPEAAYQMAHGGKPLYDRAAALRKQAAEQADPIDARLDNELADYNQNAADASAEQAREKHYDGKLTPQRVEDPGEAYRAAHGGKQIYEEAARLRQQAAEEADPIDKKHLQERADHSLNEANRLAEEARSKPPLAS